MKAQRCRVRVTEGSGNVFADVGIARPEEYLAKAELARQIIHALDARGVTQTEAARLLGVNQPKVSALRNGRLDGFSTERLIWLGVPWRSAARFSIFFCSQVVRTRWSRVELRGRGYAGGATRLATGSIEVGTSGGRLSAAGGDRRRRRRVGRA